MSVVLHVVVTKDSVAIVRLSKRDFIAKQWITEEIEVITVSCLVFDSTVAFVSVQVNQVWIILAVIKAVGSAWVALFEQLGYVSTLNL